MASFFSFATMGFGGYLVLEGALRGAGVLRPLLARIERQMRADSPALHGWLIECETQIAATIFARCGFGALAIDYRQAELAGAALAPSAGLQLMYKPLGRVYERPSLAKTELLRGLADVLRYVYGVAQPEGHAVYCAVAAQIEKGVTFR